MARQRLGTAAQPGGAAAPPYRVLAAMRGSMSVAAPHEPATLDYNLLLHKQHKVGSPGSGF